MMRRLYILAVGLIFAGSAMGAEVLRYVNPDATGTPEDGTTWAKAYPTLSAALTAEAVNLVGAGNTLRFKLHSDGTDDTTAASTGTAYTTGPANYFIIDSNSTYTLSVTNATGLYIKEDYVRVNGLHIELTTTPSTGTNAIYIGSVGTSDIRISNCDIDGLIGTDAASNGIKVNDSDATVTIWNTTIGGFVSTGAADTSFCGITAANCTAVTVLNCTIYGNGSGVSRTAGTVTATDCAVGNNTDDFLGTITIDHCCSDDGDGTNHTHPAGGDWTTEFTAPSTGNFTLLNPESGGLVDLGTDDPGVGLYGDDIVGTDRDTYTPWDIGAYEFVPEEEPPAGGDAEKGFNPGFNIGFNVGFY